MSESDKKAKTVFTIQYSKRRTKEMVKLHIIPTTFYQYRFQDTFDQK